MKARFNLTNMKSRYFMLVACLTLILGTTACSTEEFGTDLPEQEKIYTKQELIDQALSRVTMTRSENFGVHMISVNKTVSIKCKANKEVTILWGDGVSMFIPPQSDSIYTRTFDDSYLSRNIFIEYPTETTIQSLTIENNGLIYLKLDVPNLRELYCQDNLLDALDLTNCPNLTDLNISNNELTSINTFGLSKLYTLWLSNNHITQIDVSSNEALVRLLIDNNQLKEIDLTNNSKLAVLFAGKNPITDLNLKHNPLFQAIYMDHLPLQTFNEVPIESISPDVFCIYTKMKYLNISYTPFTALDLSQNLQTYSLDISGTNISKLDLSNLKMQILCATRSKLDSLFYTAGTFDNLRELRIEQTPFEDKRSFVGLLMFMLPDRTGLKPGILYTYSNDIISIIGNIEKKNWLINPQQ